MSVKISVIGTGHLGSIHARLWKNTINAELIGIFDIENKKADALSNELNCKIFSSINEALEASDAVTIAAPTSNHYEIAMKCLQQNKHCLIEKPITSNYLEAKSLIDEAQNKGLVIQVGHVERFNPALAALKDYKLNPVFIEAHRLSQFKPRATDVSVILDLMIHDIDIMLWLIKSKVKKIDANGVSILTDTPDIANARITFENGTVANLTSSRISANPMRKMRIFQKNAYISIDFGNQDVEVFKMLDESSQPEEIIPNTTLLGSIDLGLKGKKIIFEKPAIPTINAIAEEQRAFIDAILQKSPVAVSAEEAAEALRIAELINEQINQN
jgi:predicted dehydrogenase